ncbi:trypsin-like serine protease [Bdellovibrio sp. NC01]|uniref:S1 family peptidase n=1 Tax=Bdellovibrio sp. NC01 TaxID=2220073 RepID=UPI00115B7352|nr:trypsin-like serine protease [Bdellovibrio sp. NC01]QDK38125.1 hypothetical protein DOE51_11270 [Bdellovibrio sp. NC01]
MKTLVSILTFLSLSSAHAIVGGRPVTDGSFRQSVALVFKNSASESQGEAYCSGTLLNAKYVITAAHCLVLGAKQFKLTTDEFQKRTWIYVGDSQVESTRPLLPAQFQTVRFFMPPQNDSIFSDLAVLELNEAVDLQHYQIQIAPLAVADKSMIGRELIHVGYGMTDNQGPKGTKSLMSLPLRSLNGYDGLQVGEYQRSGPSACHGDSGGSAYLIDQDGVLKFIGVENAISNHPCGTAATYFVPITAQILQWLGTITKI